MSLITRCPACQTLFKVEPDQLQASEGWARCGQCQQAFNANTHLVPTLESSSVITPIEPAPAPAASASSAAEPPSQAEPPVILDVEASEVSSEPTGTAAPAAPGSGAPWRWSWAGAGWAGLAMLLTAGLLLQTALHQRNQLAAQIPAWRPLLEQLCAWSGCAITAPRQIESVVIDGSAFNRLGGDIYQLSFTLRNTAAIDLALPALELALTDAEDRAVLRRVFLPDEFQTGPLVLTAGAEFSGTLALRIDPVQDGPTPAGYRLLAFYP